MPSGPSLSSSAPPFSSEGQLFPQGAVHLRDLPWLQGLQVGLRQPRKPTVGTWRLRWPRATRHVKYVSFNWNFLFARLCCKCFANLNPYVNSQSCCEDSFCGLVTEWECETKTGVQPGLCRCAAWRPPPLEDRLREASARPLRAPLLGGARHAVAREWRGSASRPHLWVQSTRCWGRMEQGVTTRRATAGAEDAKQRSRRGGRCPTLTPRATGPTWLCALGIEGRSLSPIWSSA